MKQFRAILTIGIIEILIGSITLFVNIGSILFASNTKTPNVLLFVIIAAIISTLLGVGILKCNIFAYYLLLYFSSVVLMSKLLIFMDIIHLNGSLETTVPAPFKNGVSIIYHLYVIYFLQKQEIKEIFHK